MKSPRNHNLILLSYLPPPTLGYGLFIQLAPVVQTLDSAIHRVNHYPADKYYGNQLRYPLDGDLSGGQRYPTFEQPEPER